MKSGKKQAGYLGIAVTDGRIEAVLLRATDGPFEVVRRFKRQHVGTREQVAASSLTTVLPGLRGADESDFTLEVGSGDGNGMFLPGEFAGLKVKKDIRKATKNAPAGHTPETFVLQLKDILSDCSKAGYPNPKVGFVLGNPHVAYLELEVPRDQTLGKSKKAAFTSASLSKQERRHLIESLKEKHKTGFDEKRVEFLPMATFKGHRRYLAVIPEPQEPVTPTLEKLAEQQRDLFPSVQRMDAEVPLYIDLARHAVSPAEHENVAIVRVGAKDTLVLFLNGNRLRHQERLRSLTSYDAPETIGSRVMLQQDEQKIGEVHHLLILSDGRLEQFANTFSRVFATAQVQSMHASLEPLGLLLKETDEDPISASAVQAAGMALQLATEERDETTGLNLLADRLRRKPRRRMAIAWHTIAMLLVLFAVTFFFVQRYMTQQDEIREGRQELQALSVGETEASIEVLQARVDSLQQVYVRYTRALHVLDSLLIGSDKWSRTLEKTSRTTGDLSGVWFSNWAPQGNGIRLTGHATSRPRVARLAENLNATIHMTQFAEINDVRVHPFEIAMPIKEEVPQAALYLQDQAKQDTSAISRARLASTTSPGRAPDAANQ